MKEIFDLLNAARHVIDGVMDCRTLEYRAFDDLERAVRRLAEEIERMKKE